MKRQLTFTPEVLTCCTLDNYSDYYIWPCWSFMNIWTSWPCSVIISTRHSQKRTGHPSKPGSSLGFFLGFGLSKEFFLATVLLHLYCLLFGDLGWVSVQHFEISADVRRAIYTFDLIWYSFGTCVRVMFTVHFLLFISLLFIFNFTCFGNVNICFPCQ